MAWANLQSNILLQTTVVFNQNVNHQDKIKYFIWPIWHGQICNPIFCHTPKLFDSNMSYNSNILTSYPSKLTVSKVFGANGLIIRKQFWGQWLSTRKTLNSIVAKTFVSRKEQALKPCLICYLLCGWYFLSVYLIWIIPHNCKIILR